MSRVSWDHGIALTKLGITAANAKPPLYKQGSFADLHRHPTDPTKLIKITGDRTDAANIIAAQTLNSPNIVRCHGHTTEGVVDGTALVVDLVVGEVAPYSTGQFLGLLEGKDCSKQRHAANVRILRPDEYSSGILRTHGRLNLPECKKLSRLFWTITQLEKQLNIQLVDFAENVVDDGTAYVLVDLGE